jgi:aryl-alcohol dehydrogenase-like predicted oxidoreductase
MVMMQLALGAGEVSVSQLIHGCMGLPTEPGRAERVIHAAFDAGVTSFDTAPVYGFGSSEELLGKAIADRRGRVQILTKLGLRWDSDHGRVLFEGNTPLGRRAVRKDSRPASLRQEIEHSLRRLGVDCIDLIQVHHRDPETPIAETMEVLLELRAAGKVRAIGVSNYSRAELSETERALGQVRLASVQLRYNLLERSIEREVLPWAREHDVGVLVYSPLAKGLLCEGQRGAVAWASPVRRFTRHVRPVDLSSVGLGLAAAAVPIARERSATVAQVCLSWLLAQPGVSGVICGTTSPDRARHNALATELKLSAEEVERLSSALSQAGVRHPIAGKLVARASELARRGVRVLRRLSRPSALGEQRSRGA